MTSLKLSRTSFSVGLLTLTTILVSLVLFGQYRDDSFLQFMESSAPTLSHVILHAVGLGLSSVLLAISLMAFLRDRRARFLSLTGAFAGLVIKQTIDLRDAFLALGEFILPGTTIELGHFLDLMVILLLAVGILGSAMPANALMHRAGSLDTPEH
jgi:hypothetical protein